MLTEVSSAVASIDPTLPSLAVYRISESIYAISSPAAVVIDIVKLEDGCVLNGLTTCINSMIASKSVVLYTVHALVIVNILLVVSILSGIDVLAPNNPNPLTSTRFVVDICISVGKVIYIRHPISSGTGIAKVKSIVANSFTMSSPSASELPDDIVAAVPICKVKSPLSMSPPSDALVIRLKPVLTAVEIGFLMLVTLNEHIDPAAIALLGLIPVIFITSSENMQLRSESRFYRVQFNHETNPPALPLTYKCLGSLKTLTQKLHPGSTPENSAKTIH